MSEYDIDKVQKRPFKVGGQSQDGQFIIYDDEPGYIVCFVLEHDDAHHIAHCVNQYDRIGDYCADRDMMPKDGEDYIDVISAVNDINLNALLATNAKADLFDELVKALGANKNHMENRHTYDENVSMILSTLRVLVKARALQESDK